MASWRLRGASATLLGVTQAGWQELCEAQSLGEGEARGVDSSRGRLVLVRQGGEVLGYHNWCPHRGTTLDWAPDRFLSADGQHLQCATHGALFRIGDGICEAGSCVGQSLRAVVVECRAGKLWLVDNQTPVGAAEDAKEGPR